jgi:hypothetical protein
MFLSPTDDLGENQLFFCWPENGSDCITIISIGCSPMDFIPKPLPFEEATWRGMYAL